MKGKRIWLWIVPLVGAAFLSINWLLAASPRHQIMDLGVPTQAELDQASHETSVTQKLNAADNAGALAEITTMESLYGETPFTVESKLKAQAQPPTGTPFDPYLRIVRGQAPDPGNTDLYRKALELARAENRAEIDEAAVFILTNMRQPRVFGAALDLSRTPGTPTKRLAYAFAYCAYDFQEDPNEEVRLMRIAISYEPTDVRLKTYLALSIASQNTTEARRAERDQLLRDAYVGASGDAPVRALIEDVAATIGINL